MPPAAKQGETGQEFPLGPAGQIHLASPRLGAAVRGGQPCTGNPQLLEVNGGSACDSPCLKGKWGWAFQASQGRRSKLPIADVSAGDGCSHMNLGNGIATGLLYVCASVSPSYRETEAQNRLPAQRSQCKS